MKIETMTALTRTDRDKLEQFYETRKIAPEALKDLDWRKPNEMEQNYIASTGIPNSEQFHEKGTFFKVLSFVLLLAFLFMYFVSLHNNPSADIRVKGFFYLVILVTGIITFRWMFGPHASSLRRALKKHRYMVSEVRPLGYYNTRLGQHTINTRSKIALYANEKFLGWFDAEKLPYIDNGKTCEIPNKIFFMQFITKSYFGCKTTYHYLAIAYTLPKEVQEQLLKQYHELYEQPAPARSMFHTGSFDV